MCGSRKYPYYIPMEGIGNSFGVGILKGPNIWVNVWSLTGISRGVGDLRKNPFCGGGMHIFWNHTILLFTYLIFYSTANSTHCVKETVSDCDNCSIFWTRKVWSVNLKTTTASDALSLAFEGNTDSSNSSFSFFWIRRKHCIHRS